jgi:cytochrome c553
MVRTAACILVLSALLAGGKGAAEESTAGALADEAMRLPASPSAGARLYSEHCARCHGNQAWGAGPSATPALAGQRERYLVSKLARYVSREDVHSQMHRVLLLQTSTLEQPQAWRDVAAYLGSAARNPGAEHGNGRNVRRAAALYATNCARCHDENGMNKAVPELRGQHYSFLALRLRNFKVAHAAGTDPEMDRPTQPLTPEDVDALADYLSRQPVGLQR